MLPRESAERAPAEKTDDDAGERRRDVRHLTILRVGTLIAGGRRELCLVRNISAGGLMAHVYAPLAPGDRVEVELKTNQKISGRISWARANNLGVAFDDKVDVAEVLYNPPLMENGWRPRMPRVPVTRHVRVRSGARVQWVSTRDISQGGVRLRTDQPLEVGAETVVTLEDFRAVPGTVRWRKDGEAGISFHQVIPFAELMSWLTARR